MNDLNEIAVCIKRSGRFLLVTHSDPDADGLCSMLALGRALESMGKDVVMVSGEELTGSLSNVNGAEKVTTNFDSDSFDAVVALDCSDVSRMCPRLEKPGCPLINIDHHRSNDFFGDLDYVDPQASSTAELVWRLICRAGMPVDGEIASWLFTGVQSDTGSFIFSNTTSECLNFAAEMVSLGAKPWESWRLIHGSYGMERLYLLRSVLDTLELHASGKIAVITVTERMLQRSKAGRHDCEQLVEFPRNVNGVEIAAMMRQTGPCLFRFSLRANGNADAAELAARFGGGGHKGAAGFEMEGEAEILKQMFINAAADSLDGNAGRMEPE